jgi:hypothetical protein
MNTEILNNIIKNKIVLNYINKLHKKEAPRCTEISKELNGIFITIYNHGMELVFTLDEKLESIRLISNSEQYNTEYLPYSGPLPWGLYLDITKTEIRKLLGLPSSTREKFENSIIKLPYLEKYKYSNYALELQYNQDGKLSDILINVEKKFPDSPNM